MIEALPTFIPIPAGPFPMGTPERDLSGLAKAYGGTRESYREEAPQHTVQLPAFAIAREPVSNALYAAYVAAEGVRAPSHWRGPSPPEHLREHPVADVSWDEAVAFCEWLNQNIQDARWRIGDVLENEGLSIFNPPSSVRLPSEAEWERAARGVDGRAFPWGDAWRPELANTREAGPGATTPAGSFPAGASPVGCLDMAGNVWEWTASLDGLYPYRADDGRENMRAPGRRILRGGCYANPHGFARCACRFRLLPSVRNPFLGFRLSTSL